MVLYPTAGTEYSPPSLCDGSPASERFAGFFISGAAMRSNCLFFAVALCARRAKTSAKRRKKRDGKRQIWIGYVSVRKSFWGPFFHFLYTERRPYGTRFISFVPLKPRSRKIPPLLFEGRVKWGDGPPQR